MGSVEQEKAFDLLAKPGKWTLRSLLAFPPGKTTIRLSGNAPIVATLTAEGSNSAATGNSVVLSYESSGEAVDLAVTLTTGVDGKPSGLRASFQTPDKPGENALSSDHLFLPWVPLTPVAPAGTETTVPDLSGGDPTRGEAVFRSAESKCTTCHKIAGQGGEVGPALDSIAGRDRAWVYRSIASPSVEIHPEYVPYTVALKDGRIAAGIVRASGPDSIRVVDAEGKPTVLPKAEIEELRPSGTSIMPVGLEGAIGPEKMKNLVAYLAGSKPIGPGK